jgi:hypothetical protein
MSLEARTLTGYKNAYALTPSATRAFLQSIVCRKEINLIIQLERREPDVSVVVKDEIP